MDDFFQQVWTILTTIADPRNLTNPDAFRNALNQPGVFWAALATVNFIVFAETGLLFGFLFPGDSLLVVLGMVAHLSGWQPWLLIATLTASAIVGECVGYWIGSKAGPALFNRPDGRIFKQKYVIQARAFFDHHGGKAVIIARFMPFVRTFVPVVAGAVKMNYKTFLIYNIIGGIAWIPTFVLLGYYLLPVADPIMQKALNNPNFTIAKHIDKLVLLIVFVSVAPMLWKGLSKWRANRQYAIIAEKDASHSRQMN